MIFFNDRILPDFNHRARVMFQNVGQKKATLKLEPKIFYDLGKYSFQVEKIEKTLGEELSDRMSLLGPDLDLETKPDLLRNVTIFNRNDPNTTITVTAEEGYMVYSKAAKSLIFTLFDGEYHELNNNDVDDYRFSHFARNRVNIPAPEFEFENRQDDYRGDREMDVKMMMDKIRASDTSLVKEKYRLVEKMDQSWAPVEARLKDFRLPAKTSAPEKDELLFTSVDDKVFKRACDRAYRNVSRLYQLVRTSSSRIESYEVNINRYLVELIRNYFSLDTLRSRRLCGELAVREFPPHSREDGPGRPCRWRGRWAVR